MAGDLAVELVTRYAFGWSPEVLPWQRSQSGCATCVGDGANEACARCACLFRMRGRQRSARGSLDRSRGLILPWRKKPCAGSNLYPSSITRRATIESGPRRCRDRCGCRRLRQAASGGRGPDGCNPSRASFRGGLSDDVGLGRCFGPSRHDRAIGGQWLARAFASDDRQAGHAYAQPNIRLHRTFECRRDGARDGRASLRDRCRRLVGHACKADGHRSPLRSYRRHGGAIRHQQKDRQL
jgi:hypothetical protein